MSEVHFARVINQEEGVRRREGGGRRGGGKKGRGIRVFDPKITIFVLQKQLGTDGQARPLIEMRSRVGKPEKKSGGKIKRSFLLLFFSRGQIKSNQPLDVCFLSIPEKRSTAMRI